MSSTISLRLALAIAGLMIGGCSSSVSTKTIVGEYQVMITYLNVSDPDTLSIKPGTNGSVLLTFAAGITTDADGPNPDGLRATLDSSTQFKLAPQPAHVDHSTGNLTGSMSGEGTVAIDGTVMGTLHFTPMNGAVRDADGGLVPVPDGGSNVVLDYQLTGSRLQ
ncbi:MAG TPA: hypothetical protein VFF06_35855 [Polyangia bacterium]|nr:hypothetical protein [Polyangia bacterium]